MTDYSSLPVVADVEADVLLQFKKQILPIIISASWLTLFVIILILHFSGDQFSIEALVQRTHFIPALLMVICGYLLIATLVVYASIKNKTKKAFLNQIAETIGYAYDTAPVESVRSNFYLQKSRNGRVGNLLVGTHAGIPSRIFHYTYFVQEGKAVEVRDYTVFAYTLRESYTPIILRSKKDIYRLVTDGPYSMESVSLEGDFDTHFELYTAKHKEIWIREIFEPVLMDALVRGYPELSMEISENTIFILLSHEITTRDEFLSEYKNANDLFDRLYANLVKAKPLD